LNTGVDAQRSALFPLNTVLFPGCTLPLQIFEQRYLTLIKNCLKNNHGFIVILITKGKEVSKKPEICGVGCHVDIIDWDALDNGLLGITIQAKQRVRLSNLCSKHDGLLTADFEPITDKISDALLKYQDLVDTLKVLVEHPFAAAQNMNVNYSDANDVSNKISQLLPISNALKQSLLETDNIEDRFIKLRHFIKQLQR